MSTIVRILLLAVSLALWETTLFAIGKLETPNGRNMTSSAFNSYKTAVMILPELTINTATTAILIMDYQNEIVSMLPKNVQESLLDRASTILKKARQVHLPILYIVVRLRKGYPEINVHNKLFISLKESGRLLEDTYGSEIHAGVAPQLEDIVITKRRVGAFFNTELETILRSKNINTLVVLGIATSDVVLSTIRWAADKDYSLIVISDACADRDGEVNRILIEKIFPSQATVVTTKEFIKAIEINEIKSSSSGCYVNKFNWLSS